MEFNERLENRRHSELFRFTTDAQDNWMKPSGEQRAPQGSDQDRRSEEQKEKDRKYWSAQPTYREIYLKRINQS